MEPVERGKGVEFVDDVFGGAIPKNWIPSVEKGIRDAAARGYLAGFPVVDFRAILYDGKYHDVDSSDMAFKIAGSLAFKEAMKQARPALLEPIMHVEVYAPDQYSGDLMGDLSSRRGRISGSEARGHNVIIKAQVPLAEMLTYANDLISKTQGRTTYSMEFLALRLCAQRTSRKTHRGTQDRSRRTARRRSPASFLLSFFTSAVLGRTSGPEGCAALGAAA